jgi:hypothetical protein
LINSRRDKARDVLPLSENVRESVGKRRNRLHSWESELSNAHRFIEPEDSFQLVKVNVFLNTNNIRIQMLNVLAV